MANSDFVVIDAVHNNNHGESAGPLGFSFFCLIISWVWQPYSLQYTRTPNVSKAFIFSHTYWWVPHWIGRLLVARSRTLSSSARLFVDSALRIDCCQTNLIIHWMQSTNMCKITLIYLNAKKMILMHSNWRGTVDNRIIFGHSIN